MVMLSIVLQYVTPNVSVSSLFGGFSTSVCSLLRFLNNFFLLFANFWFWLYCLLLFTYLLILWAFASIFILRDSLVCSYWFVVTLYFIFIRCFFLENFWVFTFLYHVCYYRQISSHAFNLILYSCLPFGSCRLLLFLVGILGVLPIFSDITYALTFCSRLMSSGLGASSGITS